MTEFKTNKLEVTDALALEGLRGKYNIPSGGKIFYARDELEDMKKSLEAVFAMLPEAGSANNAQSKNEGWIEHKGGSVILPLNTRVKVIYRNGRVLIDDVERIPPSQWMHLGNNGDIVGYRIIDKPEPTQDNEKWLDYTGTCHPNTGVVKMVRLKDGDVIMLGYADFDNWPDVKAYQLWSEDHEPEPVVEGIALKPNPPICSPEKEKIPTLNQFRKNHSARNNELLVMSELDYISEYLDKYMKEKD